MFCKTCGNELNDNAVICPKCGCEVVSLKKTKEKSPVDTSKVLSIFNYIVISIICLAIAFIVCAIFYCDLNVYLTTSYYSGYSISEYWHPNYELMIASLVLGSIGFVISIIGFIFGFRKENIDKRFRSSVIFIVSFVVLFLSIIGASA